MTSLTSVFHMEEESVTDSFSCLQECPVNASNLPTDPGSDKVFYLSKGGAGPAGRMYLLALACHREIFDRGINAIHHFQSESFYKSLLHAADDKFLDMVRRGHHVFS